jgi:periplasmic copper chaperone A
MKSGTLIFVLIVCMLAACTPAANSSTSQNGIEIEQARIVVPGTATPMSGMSSSSTPMAGMDMGTSSLAGYLTIKNTGSSDDQLISASADFAGMVMLHKTVVSNNVATMQEVQSIDIPAGQTVTLQPGGFHIMFMNLKTTPQVGSKIALTLVFQKAGTISVQADVTGE